MSTLFKRTKILATIGPAVFTEEKINELVELGVNGYRLNFSHGDYIERDQQIEWIRNAAKSRGKAVAILQDLQGPKIRVGVLKDNHLDLKIGDKLTLDYAMKEHDGGLTIPVQYNLAEKVKVGEPISLFDGKVAATVVKIPTKTAIEVEIKNDGYIMSKKGLNLPDTDFGGDIITPKDMADIEFGASRDFDYVALSFIQSAADIEKLRSILVGLGSTAKIVAKIETKKAIETDEVLEDIVKATDGIMIARGDMAIEAGAEVVPIVQRKLIALCRKHQKLCIVATQMMMSMIDNPDPTRAEVSDVANAVIQGVDAVMLSDETANGKYPVETVKKMREIILYTQNHSKISAPTDEPHEHNGCLDALAKSAVLLSEEINSDAIICETGTGATASAIASYRPHRPIISVTDNPRVAGQLSLLYANSSFIRPYSATYGLDLAQELKEKGYFRQSESDSEITAVVVSGRFRDEVRGTDTIQIRKI
jgi:pyruvate kinase